MTFDINDLYIGTVGIVYEVSDDKLHLKGQKIAIVKPKDKDYYTNVIDNDTYLDFYNENCKLNCIGIGGAGKFYGVTKLHTYFQEYYMKMKKNSIILEIAKKVINYETLSYDEVKKLDCFLNNPTLFIEIYLNDKKDKKKKKQKKKDKLTYNNDLFKEIEHPIVFSDDLNKIILNLAEERKNPILIGNIGVGKTTLVKGLSYKIQKNEVPNFIKGKNIIDITDALQNNININLNKIIKNESIILIKDIYSIFNNDTNNNCYELKMAIKHKELKVIGISNEKHSIFKDNSLNDIFNKIVINEPDNMILFEIIGNVFNYYSKKNNISLCNNIDKIINILIDLTDLENRIDSCDNVKQTCNPELVIEIIDKIFAIAKVNNRKNLNIDDIIYGIESCDIIHDEAKKIAIELLKEIQHVKVYY